MELPNFGALYPVFREMQNLKYAIAPAGESPKPGVFCLDREEKFFSTLVAIAEEFRNLK